MVFLEYDYQNQHDNWHGDSSAPDANNEDKKIESHFITAGLQYMFNRSWGAQVEVPFAHRTFDSVENAATVDWTQLGDIRLRGIYTGFSEDMSTGATFGVKVPSGSHRQREPQGDIDRDTQIGYGSTDLLLGGFHRGFVAGSTTWSYFAQAQIDVPTLTEGNYRPGLEFDAAAGVYYGGFSLGSVKVSPVAQIIEAWRDHDHGDAAASEDSGYERLLLSPGVEVRLYPVKLYADVELPVYQDVNGNQLVAPVLTKINVSYMF